MYIILFARVWKDLFYDLKELKKSAKNFLTKKFPLSTLSLEK